MIVHFEAVEQLCASISSLQAGTLVPDRILVVDNSESAAERCGGRRVAEELEVEYVASTQNVGFGTACNAGLERLDDCQQLLLLNQDALVGLDAVERLSSRLAAEDRLAAVNPRIELPDRRLWFVSGTFSSPLARLTVPGQGTVFDRALVDHASRSATEWVNGCAVLVRRQAWDEVGGFDDRFFMYWEDVDLSLRLLARGWHLGVDPGALAVHDQGDTGATKLTPTVIEHSIRSRALFIRLRLDWPDRWTATAYTVVNALGFALASVRLHGVRSGPHLAAVLAGVRGVFTDGAQ